MARKTDRALGAFCIAFAAFFVVAAGAGLSESGGTFGRMTGAISLVLALLAAIPGIFLLWRGRSV